MPMVKIDTQVEILWSGMLKVPIIFSTHISLIDNFVQKSLHLQLISPIWLAFLLLLLHFRATLAHHNNYTAHMGLSAMPEAFLGQQRWYSATLQTVSGLNNFSSSKLPDAYIHVTASVWVSLLQILSPWKALQVIFLPLKTCLSNQTPHIHLSFLALIRNQGHGQFQNLAKIL